MPEALRVHHSVFLSKLVRKVMLPSFLDVEIMEIEGMALFIALISA